MVNTAFQVPPALAPAPLPRWALAAVVLLALLNLLAALGGGLVRLGTLPAGAVGPTGPQAVATHGALLMAGFFGTLIALERAVALHRGLWVPALAGLGGLTGWVLGAWQIASVLWVLSALGLLGLYLWAGWRRAVSQSLLIEASGAMALVLANLAFGWGLSVQARLAWSAFLVLTIAGERRELGRLLRLPGFAHPALAVVLSGLFMSVLLCLRMPDAAQILWWLCAAALSVWLLRFDWLGRRPGAARMRKDGWRWRLWWGWPAGRWPGTCCGWVLSWPWCSAMHRSCCRRWPAGARSPRAPHCGRWVCWG